ncbi:peptide transporter family 1 [Drosophila grimshawi]|uniref:GH17611 n=1 Tax=Drosophila grimshawi TaxID=7222 RepID=B4JX97_DROGR|nr:peptide transporter family 1 [Drosophila grimshawi]EDV95373.1 GH17611 [Drosophila grimshawi]
MGSTQVRVFSGMVGCDYRVSSNLPPLGRNFTLRGIDSYSSGNVATKDGSFTLEYSIHSLTAGCQQFNGVTKHNLSEANAHSLFLRSSARDIWYIDELEKSNKSLALVRNLANLPASSRIVWRELRKGHTVLEVPARSQDLHELSTVEYEVFTGGQLIHQQRLRPGGVYALVIAQNSTQGFVSRIFEVTEPNSMSMLWLMPQYVVMTLGEVMFSVTGLEFSYAQAPPSMKSLLQAGWLLTVAFGNVIVVIIAELKFFESQASEFFLFASIMFVDMLVFMWFAHFYTNYDGNVILTQKAQQRKMLKYQ